MLNMQLKDQGTGRKSFKFNVIKQWNELPCEVQSIPQKHIFKQNVRIF